MTVTTYLCLLRGINVSGKNLLRMEPLREAVSALGFEGVQSYLQSGNLIFDAGRGPIAALGRKIEEKLLAEFGWVVPALVRKAEALRPIVEGNPFLRESGVAPSELHVTFLSELPEKASLHKLAALEAGPDRYRALGTEIFLHCPNGYGRTKLSNTALEKVLGVRGTTRNWKTVTALEQMVVARARPGAAD
jgi:uncharacterized protein (DUF1697 family)